MFDVCSVWYHMMLWELYLFDIELWICHLQVNSLLTSSSLTKKGRVTCTIISMNLTALTVPLTPSKGVYGHLAANEIKINRLCTHLGLLRIFYFFAKLIRVDGSELTSQWRLCWWRDGLVARWPVTSIGSDKRTNGLRREGCNIEVRLLRKLASVMVMAYNCGESPFGLINRFS